MHGLDPIQTGDVDDWDAMIDINVKGLCVSKAIIPQMIERKSGHHQYWLYCCKSLSKWKCVRSKHAVDALNQGMRIDLNPFGIRPFTQAW
jgi:NADP-dependent 3-hydroxy acid dehydrogenase YdfG